MPFPLPWGALRALGHSMYMPITEDIRTLHLRSPLLLTG
jgi:hypothetical protein